MIRTVVVATIASASAFQLGAPTPLSRTAACTAHRSASQPVMMPKFLKDLFPDLDKPDDVLGGIKKMFGMEEEAPAPEPPAEEAPAEEEAPAAEDEA